MEVQVTAPTLTQTPVPAPAVLDAAILHGEHDRALVARLLSEHRSALLRFVRGRLGDDAAAEDVVQQVSMRALKHVGGLRDAAAGRAWLFRIARNALADARVLDRRAPVALDAPELAALADPSVSGEDDYSCRCVLKQAQALKAEYATLLSAVVVDGRPIVSVAAELGISANNATVRMHRARAALKQRLIDHCGTDSLRACLTCSCDERRCCGDT